MKRFSFLVFLLVFFGFALPVEAKTGVKQGMYPSVSRSPDVTNPCPGEWVLINTDDGRSTCQICGIDKKGDKRCQQKTFVFLRIRKSLESILPVIRTLIKKN